jgi:hypothetical protein
MCGLHGSSDDADVLAVDPAGGGAGDERDYIGDLDDATETAEA